MGQIDRLSYLSRFKKYSAAEKALFCVGSLLLCLVFQSIAMAVLIIAVNSILVTAVGKTPVGTYVRLIAAPALFLAVTSMTVAVEIGIRPMYISVSRSGVMRACTLMAVAAGCMTCLFALTLTTPAGDLTALMRKMRMPSLIVDLMTFMYRSVFVLWDTAVSVKRSVYSRLGDRSFCVSVHCFVRIVPSLFVLSVRRASLAYDAMEARGYEGGGIRVMSDRPKTDFRHVAAVAVYLSSLAVIHLFI